MSRFPRPLAFLRLWIAAAVLYGLADFIFSWNPWAAAPYLLHRGEGVFRAAPLFKLGVLAENLNGLAAALGFWAVEGSLQGPAWRRGAAFGLLVWGFWVLSGTMSAFIWLALPPSVALANLAFGLPKCLAIGCGLAWLWERDASPRAEAP